MPAFENTKAQIFTVLKRFKFEEFQDILEGFPEIKWSEVCATLVEKHENFTTINAVKVIFQEINKLNLNDRLLRDRLLTLQLFDISRHSDKKVWYTYKLRNPVEITWKDDETTEKIIDSCLKDNALNMICRVIKFNQFSFVSIDCIKEKSNKKRQQNNSSHYIAFIEGKKYFFTAHLSLNQKILLAFSKSMGYGNYKPIKLKCKKLESLSEILKIKEEAKKYNLIDKPIVCRKQSPLERNIGLDLRQIRERAKYADQCLGENPPALDLLSLRSQPQPWRHEKTKDLLENELPEIGWEFKSSNVPNFMRELICKKVFETPCPEYVRNFLKFGRSVMTVKEVQKVLKED